VTEINLPEQFKTLQPFVAWSLATETERNRRRHQVSMDQIVAFADAILPQVDAIVAYVDAAAAETGTETRSLPEPAASLMAMLLSLAEVAPAIECYHQPAVIDGYDPQRFLADEAFILKPAL
jgi:hypothetical protein